MSITFAWLRRALVFIAMDLEYIQQPHKLCFVILFWGKNTVKFGYQCSTLCVTDKCCLAITALNILWLFVHVLFFKLQFLASQ